MSVRGIRGAITVSENTKEAILKATEKLLQKLKAVNDLETEKIASVTFSMTSDLDQVFPPAAARDLGWTEVPLFCTQELEIKGALSKCIRVLIHYNTDKTQQEIEHIYLRKAKQLRPDLAKGGD